MLSKFKKPARGQSPDGLAIQNVRDCVAQIEDIEIKTPQVQARLEANRRELGRIVLAGNDPEAERRLQDAIDKDAREAMSLESALTVAHENKVAAIAEANAVLHKRDLATAQRNLDKRDGLGPEFTTALTKLLDVATDLRRANSMANNAKSWCVSNHDNDTYGLDPRQFEQKLAHEIWRVCEAAGVQWFNEQRESTVINREMTLAERLKGETANVMERLRSRPILDHMALLSPDAELTPPGWERVP